MRYRVQWVEKTAVWADVVADSEAEAVEKARRGEYIEGTQDSDPGPRVPKSFRVVMGLGNFPK